MVYDTSPSQAGRLDALREDVRKMAALLRAGDRNRLLCFGRNRQVVDVFGWQSAGARLDLEPVGTVPISPVNDALLIALLHRPEVGRRHLVVALTDARDAGSAVSGAQVLEVARRAEGVLHLVVMPTAFPGSTSAVPQNFLPVGAEQSGAERLKQAAVATGGRIHDRFFGSPSPVDAFDDILREFRSSYVLRYVPAGIEMAGWHDIEVRVPRMPDVTVHARRGYYGR